MRLRDKKMGLVECGELLGVGRLTIMRLEKDPSSIKFETVQKYMELFGHEIKFVKKSKIKKV